MELILASASPRRRELLEQAGLRFTVHSVDADETSDLPAKERVMLFARRKARLCASFRAEGIVLGADTMVVSGEEILGKPKDEKDALRMLHLLSGSTHQVMTGVCVHDAKTKREITDVCVTNVTFREMSEQEMLAYVASGDPMDKAGAYGIQSGAGIFVEKVEGPLDNVIGLPVDMVKAMLDAIGKEN